MSSSNITFNLVANDKASGTVNKFGGALDKQKSRFDSLKNAAKLAVGAFAVKKVIDFGAGLITAAEDGIKAQAALTNVTESMGLFGDQADDVARRLSAYADKQALATGVDDDAIRATQTKLMTFKEVAKTADEMGGHFDRATAAAIDLAAAGFGTAETNATQLGKALNDPIKGITALTKSGVTFTDAEKKKIEAMVESGNIAGAQETILKALETQVGGTAAASVTAGDKMRIKWEQVQGTLGEKLLPAFNAVSGFVTDKLLPGVESLAGFLSDTLTPVISIFWSALTGNSEIGEFDGVLGRINDAGVTLYTWAMNVANYFTTTLVPAFQNTITWITANRDWLTALAVGISAGVIAWQAFTAVTRAWMVVTNAAKAAQLAFNLVMSANPIGLIITAIAALVAGLVWFFTKTETGKKIWSGFTNFLSSSWENIKRWFSAGWSAVGRYMDLIWNVIKKVWSFTPIGMITSNWDKILAFFRSIPGKLRSFFSNLTNIITSPFKSAFNRIASLWNGTAGKLSFKAPDWVPGIGGKGFSLPQLPMLAKGGILTGPTMFVGGEGGETEVVQPLSKLDRFMRDYVPRDQVKQSGSGGDVMARMHPDDIAALATAMVAAAKRIARGELDAFADGLVGGVR